jgi:hypothetical protein
MHLTSKAVNDQELIRSNLGRPGLRDAMELVIRRVQRQQEHPARVLYA